MPDTNIIEIPRQSPRGRPATAGTGGFGVTGTQGPAPTVTRAQTSTTRGSAVLAPIEIDKLYPADKDSASDLIAALGMLADAIDLLEKARVAAHGKEAVTADRYAQRFQMLLPDLFKRRKVGDGYGVIINSLHLALINLHGQPLSFEQITTIWRVLKELRNAPFIPFEHALKCVEDLEECHLQVDPTIVAELIECKDV